MALRKVHGQAQALRILEEALAQQRLASAYLFEGPAGVGKRSCALALAKQVIAKGRPDVEARIERGEHPDFRIFAPRDEGQGNLPVDFVRQEIRGLAQYAPFEAEHAFFVFPEVERSLPLHTPAGANALLKTIEESRPGLHFLFLSHRPELVMTTLRSRAQRLPFRRLGHEAMGEILAQLGLGGGDAELAAVLIDGSIGWALKWAEEGRVHALLELLDGLMAWPFEGGTAAKALVDKLAADDLWRTLLPLWMRLQHAALRAQRGAVEEAPTAWRQRALALAEARPRERLLREFATLSAWLRALQPTSNMTLALEALMFSPSPLDFTL